MHLNDILRKLEGNTDKSTGCWIYLSAPANKHGYCKIKYNDKRIYIHRLSAHIHWGFDLNSSMDILHKICCTHTNCWNPAHLYEGTHQQNMQDKILTKTAINQNINKTHCPKGHEYNEENIYRDPNGKRRCRICRRENK